MASITLKVSGMHCGGCSGRVNKALSKLAGVKRAEASHEKAEVMVEYDETLATPAQIKAAIEKTGFELPSS